MRKMTKLYVLLGVLVVICAAVFAVSHHEEKKEQIKNSGEVILEIPTDTVTALSWTNENGTFSFTKGDETWTYDEDSAFPVDGEKMNDLLSQFESFAAAFSIEEVEDYSQYGLDEPVCTITVTAGEETHTFQLGDFSKMDEERYVSIGDGNAYLVEHDPLDDFDAILSDMILDDEIPEFDTAVQLVFSGNENYTVVRDDEAKSICADDIFFTEDEPLDTDNVETLLSSVSGLELSNYVSYNVSEEELSAFGLDNAELTITMDYITEDDEGNEESSGTLQLDVSRNVEELAAYNEALENEEEDIPEVTCYARLNGSQIVYQISESTYNKLTAVSYDTLRHQELFAADFGTVSSIDVTLDGESYVFVCTPPEDEDDEDAESVWTYQDAEFDVSSLQSALQAISSTGFTDEEPADQKEISLVIHLDNEDFPYYKLSLYRYDGTSCIAEVDGEPVAFVLRSSTVDLIEAVNQIILGS